MVERYVFLKLSDEHANDASRAEVAARAREMIPEVPGVEGVTVGTPADDKSAASWDVCIVVRFASADAIEPYQVHPTHRAFVDEVVKPRLVVVKAWNFEVG